VTKIVTWAALPDRPTLEVNDFGYFN